MLFSGYRPTILVTSNPKPTDYVPHTTPGEMTVPSLWLAEAGTIFRLGGLGIKSDALELRLDITTSGKGFVNFTTQVERDLNAHWRGYGDCLEYESHYRDWELQRKSTVEDCKLSLTETCLDDIANSLECTAIGERFTIIGETKDVIAAFEGLQIVLPEGYQGDTKLNFTLQDNVVATRTTPVIKIVTVV